MSRLVLTAELLTHLRAEMLKGDVESCAILFGRSVNTSDKLLRIITRESLIPHPDSYTIRTEISAELRPEFIAEAAQRARRSGESIIFVHTHPFPLNQFSSIDDDGEEKLADFLQRRAPQASHASLLLTPEVSIARELGKKRPLKVMGIGPEINWGNIPTGNEVPTFYDRQIRAFGMQGQKILQSLRIGIVGVGGTGSIVLQELVHLGLQDFLLIDPDVIEETNLNRLVGATRQDIGKSKVSVAKAFAQKMNPAVRIDTQQDSVIRASVARSLADADFVFCCTDSHGSRAVLNQLAYQYLIPIIDMGVVIATQSGHITHVAARTQLLANGLACMTCGNLLDAEEIRRDLLTDFERQADPYIIGDPEPAPAVISLNATIASLATTMFLNTTIGVPGKARFLNYDAISGVCRPVVATRHPSCIVCSAHGALARADEWPLPARQD